MKYRYQAIAIVLMLIGILYLPVSHGETFYNWEQWNDDDSVDVELVYVDLQTPSQLQRELIGLLSSEGYSPGSTFYCYNPYLYIDNSFQKGVWLSNVKPVRCVWIYYDPHFHVMCKEEHTPKILSEGNFNGYKYAFADHNEFIIPALFLSDRYGDWLVRSYFVFENGQQGGEGPVVDENGNSYLISFPVVKGSAIDLIFNAPIYLFGYKTIPLFWWLTPIWALGIFFLIMVIWTKSIKGAISVIKKARQSTSEAVKEWRRK